MKDLVFHARGMFSVLCIKGRKIVTCVWKVVCWENALDC